MKMSKRETIIAIVAVVVVAGGLYWAFHAKPEASPQTSSTSTSTTTTNNTPASATETEDTSSTHNGTVTNLSYSAALNLYKDHRIQFGLTQNGSCSAMPTSAVFRNGTAVMLDNRTGKPLTLSIDGNAYAIKAYGFKIVTLSSSASLPHKTGIDCNDGRNTATITLE